MTDEEAEQFLLGTEPKGSSNMYGALPGPTPPSIAGRTGPMQAAQGYLQRNQQEGIALDTETGIGTWQNLMLDWNRNKENQLAYLQKHYKDGVRLDENGDWIVRAPDVENPDKMKDIKVSPNGKLNLDDFLAISAFVPEIAGSLAAIRYAKMVPALQKTKMLTEVGAGAVGGETAGGIKDVFQNLINRGVFEVPEVAKERVGMGVADVAIGAASYPLARFFQFMKNPLQRSRGEVQFNLKDAQEYFAKDPRFAGIVQDYYPPRTPPQKQVVPVTIGESTGNPMAGRTEVFVESQTGGAHQIRALKQAQENAFRRIQRTLMGGTPPPDEAFGQGAMDVIRSRVNQPAAVGVERASTDLAQTAEAELLAALQQSAPGRELRRELVGKEVRSAVIQARDTAQAEADRLYGIVKSLPEGQGKFIDGGPLQHKFKELQKSIASAEQTVTKPTGLLDEFGNVIAEQRRVSKPVKTFLPEKILPRLQEVLSMKDPKFGLSDLVQMRTEVYDDIARAGSEGVSTLPTHKLSEIGNALNKSITDGINALPTGDLKTALEAANKHWKEKVVPFRRTGLTELFKDQYESGYVTDEALVSRLFTGDNAQHNWDLIKETVPTPVFDRVRRSVLDTIIERARLIGNDTLDATTVANGLQALRDKHFTIYEDVVGNTAGPRLKEALLALSYQQGKKIDTQQFANLVNSGSITAQKVQRLMAAQSKRDQLYKNQLFKAIGSGDVTEETLQPVEFVNRLLETSSPTEVRQVVDAVKTQPDLMESLKQKTFEKVFRDAARGSTATDINRMLAGDPSHILSGVKIGEALQNPTYRTKLETILGQDGMEDLKQYARLQAGPEQKEASFKVAGGLAAGARIAQVERGGIIPYLGASARYFIFSTLLTKGPLYKWMISFPEEPAKWAMLFRNPLFIKAVVSEFGEGAEPFMHSLNSAVNTYAQQYGKTNQAPSAVNGGVNSRDAEIEAALNRVRPNQPKQ